MLNKPVSKIEFNDLNEFCMQQNPESSWLDYKRALSSRDDTEQVANIVSALANAHGGWVLYGISEKQTGGPGIPDKIVGIERSTKPAERIQQICLNSIYPPIVPELGIVEIPPGPENIDRIVVIIRVYESDCGPHRTNKGEVRIRTNDFSHPLNGEGGQPATVDDIEALLNRRSKPIAEKARLLERSAYRRRSVSAPSFSVVCVPTFPSKPMCDLATLKSVADSCAAANAFEPCADRYLTVNEGVFASFQNKWMTDNNPKSATAEFGIHGLVVYCGNVSSEDQTRAHEILEAVRCLKFLWSTLWAADLLYRECAYAGLVDLSVILNIEGWNGVIKSGNHYGTRIPDGRFTVATQTYAHSILTNLVIDDIFKRFLWSSGYGESAADYPVEARLGTIRADTPIVTRQPRQQVSVT